MNLLKTAFFKPHRLDRKWKRFIVYLCDAALFTLASTLLFFSFTVEFSDWVFFVVSCVSTYSLVSIVSRSHQTIIHSSNFYIFPRLSLNILATFVVAEFYTVFTSFSVPTIHLVATILLFAHLVFASRVIARYVFNRWFSLYDTANHKKTNTLIYGAGYAGKQVVQALSHSSHRKLVGLIDDNKDIHNQIIGSIKVYRRAFLPKLIREHRVREIIVCMPSLNGRNRHKLLNWLQKFPVKISIVPDIEHIMDGEIKVNDIKEVKIEDLLSRKAVTPSDHLLKRCTGGKNVMITGAGGSIGSEICRQVLSQEPKVLVLYELSEYNLYVIERELLLLKEEHNYVTKIYPILGDVKDKDLVKKTLESYTVNTIYHAAAYKHVPLVEANAKAGYLNNVIGTKTVAECAGNFGVRYFVLISTDKAVRPTNIMGATKRLAEQSVQALQDLYPKTTYSMVRFGNVLGSSGSVIPLFRKQIALGGPVTVTDSEMIRYFMTIPEAASLVIQAGAMASGGEVFVLDMGKPIKIVELAKRMIHLGGLKVVNKDGDGDIKIEYVGLRPGEKLYEELLISGIEEPSDHPRIRKTKESYPRLDKLEIIVEHGVDLLADDRVSEFKEMLCKTVEGYVPHKESVE